LVSLLCITVSGKGSNLRPMTIESVIRSRRTTKPQSMNGQRIPDAQVQELLELADWAPTHAYTEPWYFVVYGPESIRRFCKDHAELYKSNTPPEKFATAPYEKLETMGDQASHVIALCMKRGDNSKIPEQEELEAVACAVQNILLGATARGLATYWGSGGMTYHPAMKAYLGLGEADKVLGFLYLGYAENAQGPGRRLRPLEEKVRWVQ
jgi:nitroreductase